MQFPELPHNDAPSKGVFFHFEDVEFDLPDTDRLEKWLMEVAAAEQVPFLELNCIFCSDEHLHGINMAYLSHDFYTDIITFPFANDAVYGELYISVERVTENAKDLKVDFSRELHRVLVHGVLHLCGYGDKSEAEANAMRAKEDHYLQQL